MNVFNFGKTGISRRSLWATPANHSFGVWPGNLSMFFQLVVSHGAQRATANFLGLKLADFLAPLAVWSAAWCLLRPLLLCLVPLYLRSLGENFLFFHMSLAAPLAFSLRTVRILAMPFLTAYRIQIEMVKRYYSTISRALGVRIVLSLSIVSNACLNLSSDNLPNRTTLIKIRQYIAKKH